MVASVTGPVMAIRADVGYASAKAGMVGLTRCPGMAGRVVARVRRTLAWSRQSRAGLA